MKMTTEQLNELRASIDPKQFQAEYMMQPKIPFNPDTATPDPTKIIAEIREAHKAAFSIPFEEQSFPHPATIAYVQLLALHLPEMLSLAERTAEAERGYAAMEAAMKIDGGFAGLARKERDAAEAHVKVLKEALRKLETEHLKQANEWDGEEGDSQNAEYHAGLARIATQALGATA